MVRLLREARPTWPASAAFTSARPAWFSTALRASWATSESPRTQPARSMSVTRHPSECPRESASSGARSPAVASSPPIATTVCRALRSRPSCCSAISHRCCSWVAISTMVASATTITIA